MKEVKSSNDCNSGHHHCHQEKKEIETLVSFHVDGKEYYLPRGYYLVSDLKKVANVPSCHILAEIRDGEVDGLTDDTVTHISGCENFKPFPGKGDAA